MASAKKSGNQKIGKEESYIVKPVAKGYGLDYLHLALIVLVAILIGLSFALAYSKPATIINCQNSTSSASGCGATNSTAQHNATAVLAAAEHDLVYYSTVNTSLSLLPYYSLVNRSTVSYIPSEKSWLVIIPYINPFNKSNIFNFSMILYDSNLSAKNSFINSVNPRPSGPEHVAALGAISLDTTAACTTTKPQPLYLITDPYAPGAIAAVQEEINATALYGNSISPEYYFVFSKYAISRYAGYGLENTQLLGNYMFCASKQHNFKGFISNLSIAFAGEPMDNTTLSGVAIGSSLNTTTLNACLTNSSVSLNYQAELAEIYNITTTPEFVVNCKYLAIPQTLYYALNYSLGKTS